MKKEIHGIKNEFLSAGILHEGAELCSLINLKTGTEYIWQGDAQIWSSHAPNLFPVIGILKNGEYSFNSKKYALPKHGFVRYNKDLQLREAQKNKVTFQLQSSEETLKMYPFKFSFEISFSLEGKVLKIDHKISNLDNQSMYFSLGGHPAFNAPLHEGETYEDYYLKFDQKQDLKTYLLNEDGLVSCKTATITENDDTIRLHKDIFKNDALIFKDITSKKVTLKSKKSGSILSVEYGDFENLGIWAKHAAPFVCIEPWLGIADTEESNQQLKTKEGIIELMPSKVFTASYSIKIEQV